MPGLTLLYYDIPGRAEVIRKTFKVAGVPFKDDRFPQAEHPERKSSQPYGKVPILSVDDEVIAETHAILRYAARVGGLYPPASEPLAAAMIDEIFDSLEDFFERVLMASFVERDAEKKKAMRLELLNGPLPDALQLIEKRLGQIAEYEFFKDNADLLFVHDVVVWEYVVFFRSGIVDHVPTTFIDSYKTMVAMHDKVASHSVVHQQQQPVHAPPAIPTKLKLAYFDMPGRAEQTRLALHIGGIAFEDERLSSAEYAKRKHEFPNAQLPVLEVDGVVLAQSFAILRYAGTLTSLYPAGDALQAAKVDEIMSHIGELYFTIGPSFQEQDPEKKREMREALIQGPITHSLSTLEKRLALRKTQNKTDSQFAMGGETLTTADLVIYSLVEFFQSGFLDHVPTTIVDPYKNILQSNDAVKNHPRVKDWYAAHPLPSA